MIKDEALCLSCRLYSESSQIATLFCRQSGKLQIIAKGSRKEKARFAGGLDPLTTGNIIFTPASRHDGLATLTEFDLKEAFMPIRKQLPTLYAAQYLCQLVQTFLEQQDPHENVYDGAIQSLHALQTGSPVLDTLVDFEQLILQEIGLAPQWHRCSSCARPLQQNQTSLYFSSQLGGMICRDCEPTVIEKRLINAAVWNRLKNLQEQKLPEPTAAQAHDILYYHLREQAGKELSIEKLVRQSLAKQQQTHPPKKDHK